MQRLTVAGKAYCVGVKDASQMGDVVRESVMIAVVGRVAAARLLSMSSKSARVPGAVFIFGDAKPGILLHGVYARPR